MRRLVAVKQEPLQLPAASWREAALQAGCQGVLSGIVAMFAHAVAVRRLGPSGAAAFNSLTPAVAALLAIPVLGEIPDLATAIGIVAAGLGVALASGAVGGGRRAAIGVSAARLEPRKARGCCPVRGTQKKSEPRGARLEVEQGGVNEGWMRTGEVLHPNQQPHPIGNV